MRLSKTFVHAAVTVLLSAPLALAIGGNLTGTASVQKNCHGHFEVVIRSDGTSITFGQAECDSEDWGELLRLAKAGKKVHLTIVENIIKTVEEVK